MHFDQSRAAVDSENYFDAKTKNSTHKPKLCLTWSLLTIA